jgi:hypothetical protein
MDKKSKIFFVVFSLLIVGSIAATYYRYFIVRDYMIEAQADCDPSSEACFVTVCDPESEECSGDPEQDTTYYAVIHRNARNIPLCDPSDEGCDALVCPEGEADCSIDFCDPQTVPEGTVCNDPTTYTLLHPAEETEDDASGEGDAAPGDMNESEQPVSGEGDVGSDVPVK